MTRMEQSNEVTEQGKRGQLVPVFGDDDGEHSDDKTMQGDTAGRDKVGCESGPRHHQYP